MGAGFFVALIVGGGALAGLAYWLLGGAVVVERARSVVDAGGLLYDEHGRVWRDGD